MSDILVFEWSKCIRFSNGLIFEWWSENITKNVCFMIKSPVLNGQTGQKSVRKVKCSDFSIQMVAVLAYFGLGLAVP